MDEEHWILMNEKQYEYFLMLLGAEVNYGSRLRAEDASVLREWIRLKTDPNVKFSMVFQGPQNNWKQVMGELAVRAIKEVPYV